MRVIAGKSANEKFLLDSMCVANGFLLLSFLKSHLADDLTITLGTISCRNKAIWTYSCNATLAAVVVVIILLFSNMIIILILWTLIDRPIKVIRKRFEATSINCWWSLGRLNFQWQEIVTKLFQINIETQRKPHLLAENMVFSLALHDSQSDFWNCARILFPFVCVWNEKRCCVEYAIKTQWNRIELN